MYVPWIVRANRLTAAKTKGSISIMSRGRGGEEEHDSRRAGDEQVVHARQSDGSQAAIIL
jgi:hypothetical protein